MNYTLEQYQEMVERFNKMTFYQKIKTIRDNPSILTLASDGNWWTVKVKDEDIQEALCDNGFEIENEWGSSEICDLVALLGIGNVDI